jgi:RimJ/RimL family protein N-acetyltransferase
MLQKSPTLINGTRIRLRDWLAEDVSIFEEWQKPGHLWQTLDGPYYRSETDDSRRLAEELGAKVDSKDFPDPRTRLVIADGETNCIYGTVSTYWESKETNWLCAGIILYDPRNWGKGLGYEAMGLWIDYLFRSYPAIVRLDMRTWSGNTGLMALARKLGFAQEACFRKARFVNGEYYDGLGYGILKTEWKDLHPKGFGLIRR